MNVSELSVPPSTGAITIANLILISIQVAMFVVALSNLIVMFTIGFVRSMHTVTNIYIFNLCAADFLYIGMSPFSAAYSYMRTWIFDKNLCHLFFTVDGLGKYCSAIFITILSIDRYLALCKPHWCERNRSVPIALLISLVIWIIVGTCVAPLFVYSQVVVKGEIKMCTIKWPSKSSSNWFLGFSFLFNYLFPVFIIVFCYIHVLRKLEEALRSAKRLRRSKNRENRYRKVTRMVLSVIGFYLICWSPYWIYNILAVFLLDIRQPGQSFKIIMSCIHLLPYINSSLNPLLYALMNQDFKEAMISPQSCYRYCCNASSLERGTSIYVSAYRGLSLKRNLLRSTTSPLIESHRVNLRRPTLRLFPPATMLLNFSSEATLVEETAPIYRAQSTEPYEISSLVHSHEILFFEQTPEVYL